MTDTAERDNKWIAQHLIGAESPEDIRASSGPKWLIEEWLASSATILSGKPEVGKSTLAAQLAAAVSTGSEWHGKSVTTDRTGPVIIVVADPGDSQGWADKAEQLKVPEGRWLIAQFDPNNWVELVDAAATLDAPLLVFDNVTGALGGPLNDVDPSEILSPLTEIANSGTAVLLLAHAGRSGGSDPMGATAYKAWRRHGLEMTGSGNATRSVKRTGNNGTFPPVKLGLNGESVSESKPEGTTRQRSADKQDTNLEKAQWVVENCQGIGVNQTGPLVADKFGGSPSTATKDLKKSGQLSVLLERTGEGTTTKWSLKTE